MVTSQKKAITVGVAALLILGSTNLHAAEGALASGGASVAGGALGGISFAARRLGSRWHGADCSVRGG